MKYLITLLFAGVFVLSSCQKEQKKADDPAMPGKKYPVTFNLTNNQELGASNKLKVNSVTPINSHDLRHLLYVVYKGTTPVHSILQDSTAKNYGSIIDSLPAGNYNVVFLASKLPIQVDQGAYVYLTILGDDFFYKKISLTVGSSPVGQPVTLDRVAAKLQIVIQDTIPSDVTSILVQYRDVRRFSLLGGLETNQVAYTQFAAAISPSDVGKSNFTMEHLVYNFFEPFSVSITPISKNRIWSPVFVNSINMKSNQVTVLKGGLFAPTTHNAGFQITVSPDWTLITNKPL